MRAVLASFRDRRRHPKTPAEGATEDYLVILPTSQSDLPYPSCRGIP